MSEKTLPESSSIAIEALPSQMARIYDKEHSDETMTEESSEHDAEENAGVHNDEELREIVKWLEHYEQ